MLKLPFEFGFPKIFFATEYLKTKNVDFTVIRGIEVNTLYKDYEVHILGYFPDVTKSDFKNLLKIQQHARIKQTKEILHLLAKKEGIKIDFDDVKNMVAEGGSIGRPHIAKAITTAAVWIDEIEKGLSGLGSNGDSGVSSRIFGQFLTWMQEKEAPVFVIATANNISNLPPELLRKGRFDEIFFVDLPTLAERKEIFKLNLSETQERRLPFPSCIHTSFRVLCHLFLHLSWRSN